MRGLTLKVTGIYLIISGLSFLIIYYVASTMKNVEWFWPAVFGIYLLGVAAFLLLINSGVQQIVKLNE